MNSLLLLFWKIHLLLTFSYLFWFALREIAVERRSWIGQSEFLRMTYGFAVAGVALPWVLSMMPFATHTPSALQIWSAPSFRGVPAHVAAATGALTLSLPSGATLNWEHFSVFERLGLLLLVVGALWTWVQGGKALFYLRKIARSGHRIRRLGRVEIITHDLALVPYSFRWLGTAFVVIPPETLTEASRFKIALQHELQHHRQGDTAWAHWMQWTRVFLFWNPIALLWEKQIAVLQEFACDEALVARAGVSPHAYARCLLKAAESCLGARPHPVGTTGLAASASGNHLKRRIDRMFDYRRRKGRSQAGRSRRALPATRTWILGTLSVLLMVGAAWASQDIVKDRRLTIADGKHLAELASQGNNFPIVMNEAVLEELNRFVGTPDGREYVRKSLERMQALRPMMSAKAELYGLPQELLAVPLLESGYRNIVGKYSSGLWQFIASTARHYGLQVNPDTDERMDMELETDAAMRYLSANFLRFRDWLLAIEAYNAGEKTVQDGIDATGSRDAWKIIDAGYGNDRGYLAGVMAAVIILKNPSLLN